MNKPNNFIQTKNWRNLAPKLIRQRVIIEGTTKKIVEPEQIEKYLLELSKHIGMTAKGKVLTYAAEDKKPNEEWSSLNMGYAGWLYWVSSGVHFHSYPTNPPLFSVDAYTCKKFSVKDAVEFTKSFFNPIEIVYLEITI